MKTTRARHSTIDGSSRPVERRGRPRIYYPLPVKVRGSDFEFETVVDDLGAGGICSRSLRKISPGERLRFMVEFSLPGRCCRSGRTDSRKLRISARGIVTRIQDLQDGTFKFAAKFTHYLFV